MAASGSKRAKPSPSPVDAFTFSFSEEEDPEQPDNISVVEVEINDKASGEQCGSVSASLVCRPGNMSRGGFHMVTDETAGSSELGECAQALCADAGGKLLPQVRRVLKNAAQCDSGGLLYIEDVKLDEAHRGLDVGLHAVSHLLSQLQGRWSLAIVFPASTDREENKAMTQAQMDAACASLARHFARLGFVQAGEHRPESRYWLLEASVFDGVVRAKQNNLVVHCDPPAPAHDQDDAELDRRLADFGSKHFSPYRSAASAAAALPSTLDSLGVHVTGARLDGIRAVHIAVANRFSGLLPLLQRAGANMNLADETGAVPLHIAADTLDLASVSALLALGAGASKQLKTLKGDTPLALAKQAVTRQNAFFRRLGMPGPVNAGDIAAQQQIPQLLK